VSAAGKIDAGTRFGEDIMKKKILVTGAAGFIGSHFVEHIACSEQVASQYDFILIDALTYAADQQFLKQQLSRHQHLTFYPYNICDEQSLAPLFQDPLLAGVIHFAAESHVDQSIAGPGIFIQTNIVGTHKLLQLALTASKPMRFLQVSTDEVYGTLKEGDAGFTELTPLTPNSPYSASKASADLLVRSYVETFHLDAVITRCSNNYGIRQHSEKFIPTVIRRALTNQPVPIYGTGKNIRDWIHVHDHVEGIWMAFQQGKSGEVYNFGGQQEKRNLELAQLLLSMMDRPASLLQFVTDRQGHDWRYAVDCSKAMRELGWRPKKSLESSLKEVVEYYLALKLC
jgi:dTDP-glucose 4,6-dehydratase